MLYSTLIQNAHLGNIIKAYHDWFGYEVQQGELVSTIRFRYDGKPLFRDRCTETQTPDTLKMDDKYDTIDVFESFHG